jgi:hypothetical protein
MPPIRNRPPTLKSLSPAIHGVLSRLRARIRWLVLLEGIATAVAWLLLTFWVALAIDYLPVRFGFSELTRTSRIVILVLVSALIASVLYRLVLRRVFVRMKDGSMAMLIERKYPQFGDSLLTTVSRTESQPTDIPVDESMQERTRLEAESHLQDIEFSAIVNSRPLRRSLIFAGLLLVSIVALAIAKPAVLQIAAQRLYLLRAITWPRRCQLEMVGIKIKRENPVEGIEEFGQFLLPVNGEFRVAKGSTLTVMVRAKGPTEAQTEGNDRRLPESCSLIYRMEDGNRGVQAFKKIGAPRDGYQLYSLDGQPLRGILNDITFDILGGDYRLGPFKLAVVDEPYVVETMLALKYPAYIVDEDSGSWTDRAIPWTGQARLPEGTAVTVLAKSKKELTKVYALDRTHKKMNVIAANGNKFSFEIPSLNEPLNVQFYLCDTDALVAEQPHTVSIDPIKDQPPIVQTRLSGIGTAVTPDVQIPITGSVTDDYGLKRTWIEIEIDDSPAVAEKVTIGAESELDAMIDFKQRRQESGAIYALPVGDQNSVQLVIKSEDKCDLRGSPNVGIGDKYTLDIVAPNQLLMILERLEVGQRQRLEQIYLELVDARKYLTRAKAERLNSQNDLVEPGDKENRLNEPGDDATEYGGLGAIRKHELRLLFAQRAILQVDKSTQEILGSAEAFENIRLQLINNRIDSEDRKIRISDQIIAPLRLIGDKSMRQLKQRVVKLELSLRDLQISPQDELVSQTADQLSMASIEQLDIALNQLDLVLAALVKYETQNELLEIVRRMIKTQQDVMERTRKERQRKAFEGLLD